LESVVSTFVKPAGAHRNTQNPHIVAFEGCVAVSYGSLPAPTVSALNPDYRDEVAQVAAALNRIRPESIAIKPFQTPGGFASVMADLVAAEVG
jgi:CRISPR-associated protein Cst2